MIGIGSRRAAWLSVWLALAALCLSLGRPARAQDPVKALDAAERATVRVLVVYVNSEGHITESSRTGSGFIVAPGNVVTNAHVVPDTEATRLVFVVPHRDVSAKGFPAQVLDISQDNDLALLSVPGLTAAGLDLTEVMPTKQDTVHALGYPGVTDEMRGLSLSQWLAPAEPYVTQGSIALFSDYAPGGSRLQTIFHTAALNPGNSGGPLIDACGRVIGVNTWEGSATVSSEGISVPSGQFVASRSANLVGYLRSRGVQPQVDDTPCVVSAALDPAVEARLKAAEEAVAAEQKQRAAEQAAIAAERAQHRTVWIVLGGVAAVVLVVAVALAARRRFGAGAQTSASSGAAASRDAYARPELGGSAPIVQTGEAPRAEGKPSVPLVLVISGGVLLGVAVFAFWQFAGIGDGDRGAARPVSGGPPPARAVLVCSPAPAQSRNAPPTAGSLLMTFDSTRACVNDRTLYAAAADGYARTLVVPGTRTVSRLKLSRDLTRFERQDFILEPADFARLRKLRVGIKTPSCPASGGPTAQDLALLDRATAVAEPFAQGAPDRVTSWSCKPQPMPGDGAR